MAANVAGTREERGALAGAALVALATTLMLEGLRVFVAYLVFVVDQSQRVELAAIVFGVFLAGGLGGLLARLFGLRHALVGAALVVAAVRLTLQFWQAPEPRVVLGALVVLGWGWLMIAALSGAAEREAVAVGLTAGLALDVVLRIVFRAVDLPWTPDAARDVVTALLVGGLVVALLFQRRTASGIGVGHGSAASLAAIGPGIALYCLMAGNIGLAEVKLDDGFASAAWALILGQLFVPGLALFALLWPLRWRRTSAWWQLLACELLVVVIVGAWIWQFWRTGRGDASAVSLITIASQALLYGAVLGPRAGRQTQIVSSVTFWFTTGLLVQAALLFIYYAATGSAVIVVIAYGLLALGALATQFKRPDGWRVSAATRPLAAVVVVGLVVAGLFVLAAPDAPRARVSQLPADVTIMTYNIQSGFSRDNVWSLEGTARTIEAARPDIVVLEEVSRGWLVTTGNDELLWLSRRLDMPYVWGPASDDGLWGNAILSRAPLLDAATVKYASTQNLKRSAVRARVATAGGDLWIYGTHLDNPSGAGAVRREQVDALLDFWSGTTPAVVAGDLNATPGSDVLGILADAGFSDLGATLGPSATTSEDGKRIDYILATNGVTLLDANIPDVWTSDHRPFVARVRLGD